MITLNEISDFFVGDNVDIERDISNIPVGETLTTAWFTVKRKITDTDADAIMQKVINSGSNGDGVISDIGIDGTGHVKFTLSSSETLLLSPSSEYFYDIQVKTSGDRIFTKDFGKIIGNPQITITTT